MTTEYGWFVTWNIFKTVVKANTATRILHLWLCDKFVEVFDGKRVDVKENMAEIASEINFNNLSFFSLSTFLLSAWLYLADIRQHKICCYLKFGNCILSVFFSSHPPQAQCLINVSGDAVIFVRESELEMLPVQPSTVVSQPTSSGGDVTTWR